MLGIVGAANSSEPLIPLGITAFTCPDSGADEALPQTPDEAVRPSFLIRRRPLFTVQFYIAEIGRSVNDDG